MMRSAYLVSLARADGVEGEMLILVPAETRSEAHRVAQTKARERDGWEHSQIVESLRCPGPPKEAAAHVQRMLKGHMSEVSEEDKQTIAAIHDVAEKMLPDEALPPEDVERRKRGEL